MKKLFFTLFLACFTLTINAQFKIHSNGYLSFGTNTTPQSPISLNCNGASRVYTYYKGAKTALQCVTDSDDYCSIFLLKTKKRYGINVGVNGYSQPYQNYTINSCIGVEGMAESASSNIGVRGLLGFSFPYGTGVMGSSVFYGPSITNRSLAGYFYGNVEVSNNLIVEGSIQGTVLGRSASGSQSANTRSLPLNTADAATAKMLRITPMSYQLDSRELSDKRANVEFTYSEINAPKDVELKPTPLKNIIEDQTYAKTHYGFDAKQLEELYPDLVYEEEDGSKAINYIEMIPLLVQCINELTTEVATLKGYNAEGTLRKVPAATTASLVSTKVPAASLRQNTPNPFTERTTIGFTLPDDARNAYIYIFDMQGKMQKQLPIDPSMQSVAINGYELQPGLYLYSLVIDGQEIDTKRMILSK